MNRARRLLRTGAAGAAFAALAGYYFVRPASSNSPQLQQVTIGGVQLVRIPGGRFTTGSPEGPAPRDTDVGPFLIGRCEITAAQFAMIDGSTPAPGRADLPAAGMDVHQAEAWCRRFGRRNGVAARLPTETEWEFAARGGLAGGRYPWGWGDPGGRACFDAEGPAPAGSHAANAYGLHDMAGNVFEWCAAPQDATEAAARGGSWAERSPDYLRVFHRVLFPADYADADVGFRIVVEQ